MPLPTLIPRSVLFGEARRFAPALSPCGRLVGYVAPLDGVANVWVEPLGGGPARAVTADRGRGVTGFGWAPDSTRVLYQQDVDGDERTHLFAADVGGGPVRDLTPFDGVQARLVAVSPDRPGSALVGLNRRDPRLHDLFLLNLADGRLTAVAENPGYAGWITDRRLRARGGFRWEPDGSIAVHACDAAGSPTRPVHHSGPEDAAGTRVVGVDADDAHLIVLSPAGADTARALRVPIDGTGPATVLHEDPGHDVVGVGVSPVTGVVDLAVVHRERRHLVALHPRTAVDVDRLRRELPGDIMLLDRDAADRRWLLLDLRDDAPSGYHVYDRDDGTVRLLFEHRPELAGHRLAAVEPFRFTARDGLTVHGYLTFPVGVPRSELPTVVAVHGGPWTRDLWASGGDAQWLANRGYLCVQVNFRGSTGYGKRFVNAGNREWGGRMQDDLVDAVHRLVDLGHADPARVAVYGSSYGGYAALVGATFPPQVFRCAIAVSAPSDLRSFVRSAATGSALMRSRLVRCIGDPVADADFLWSRSPLSRVDGMDVPVLVAHGARDPRVPVGEASRVVDALRRNGVAHRFLLFDDEGHGFVRPRNRLAFHAAAEAFLAEHLGGRNEP